MMPVTMVGRAAELREIGRAWDRVTARERPAAGTVVVTGAAGVGKSLLVAAALDSFTPRPYNVLRGMARVHGPAPYDWLACVLSGHPLPDLPVPAEALAWLAQLPGTRRERYTPGALLRLAVRAVRSLVADGPAVLVVEDLHALDPASLTLVAELAAADLPALLLVTSQPAAAATAPDVAARALARLRGVPGAVRQHLAPLDRGGVAAVLAQVYPDGPVPDEVVAAAHRHSGGNPYRLLDLLAVAGGHPSALLAGPVGADPAGAGAPPPDAPATAGPPDAGCAAVELTAREEEVLACLAAGMSNKQVARSLGISIRTVGVHVSNLLRKTRSASRTEAALWAVRNRLASGAGGR
jgi:DNA-binding CsgD family transcriptional regulator